MAGLMGKRDVVRTTKSHLTTFARSARSKLKNNNSLYFYNRNRFSCVLISNVDDVMARFEIRYVNVIGLVPQGDKKRAIHATHV